MLPKKLPFYTLPLTLLLALSWQPQVRAQADPAVQPGPTVNTGPATIANSEGTGSNAVAEKDIILVLDNSGSMRQNDPGFLAKRAVTEFIDRLDGDTRLAIIIFDQDVSLALPLTEVTAANKGTLLASLDRINYKGLFTDSPAAMERAIYELKNNGRKTAMKLIVFMTDGIVDTGNAGQDLDKSRWLRENLAPDAANAGIRIFGIAFTEAADFRLIQSLAQISGGEYYRTLKAEDLDHVFEQIHSIIQNPPASATAASSQMTPTPEAPPAPVIVEVPAQAVPAMGQQERVRSLIMIIATAVLIPAVLAILVLLLRRGRGQTAAGEEFVSEAFLNDIHGYTPQSSYKLGKKPIMLGRVAGMDTDHLDFIVIPQSTIGRRHSLIEYKDYAYWIIDQGSINGTFVNDVPITSEVRLKHGDKVRLHKYEFDFVMPEMADAGKTVVSQTMLAGNAPEVEEATELKGPAGSEKLDLDFDLGIDAAPGMKAFAASNAAPVAEEDTGPEDETLIPGGEMGASRKTLDESDEFGPEDATLMPDHESEAKTPPRGTPVPGQREKAGQDGDSVKEDETLIPGDFNLPEEDATIRKDADHDKSYENFLDIGGLDNKKDK